MAYQVSFEKTSCYHSLVFATEPRKAAGDAEKCYEVCKSEGKKLWEVNGVHPSVGEIVIQEEYAFKYGKDKTFQNLRKDWNNEESLRRQIKKDEKKSKIQLSAEHVAWRVKLELGYMKRVVHDASRKMLHGKGGKESRHEKGPGREKQSRLKNFAERLKSKQKEKSRERGGRER